mgnify:CR=1 FL=1
MKSLRSLSRRRPRARGHHDGRDRRERGGATEGEGAGRAMPPKFGEMTEGGDYREVMHCPHCRRQHLDRRWWAHRPHTTHTCAYCGEKWESKRPMIGVRAEQAGVQMPLFQAREGKGRDVTNSGN